MTMIRLLGRLAFYALLGAGSLALGSVLLAVLGAVLGVLGAVLPFILIGAIVWGALRPTWHKAKQKLPLEDLPVKRRRVVRGLRHAAAWGCVNGAAGLAHCRRAGVRAGEGGCRWALHTYTQWAPTVSAWCSRTWDGTRRHGGRVAGVLVEVGCGSLVGAFLGLLAGGQTHQPEPYLLAGAGIGALLGLAVGLLRPGVHEIAEG
jgi:hypothetical protein